MTRPASILRKVNVVYTLPFLVESDSIDVITDSSFIYYFKNYRIYEVPAREMAAIYNILIYDSLKSNFFVYDTAKSYGYYVKSLQDSLEKKLAADSFIRSRPSSYTYEKLLSISKLKRESSPSKNELLQVYGVNDGAIDSAFFYYDKSLKDVPFSFSKKLDSKYNSKLHQVELLMKMDTSTNAIAFNKYRRITWRLGETKMIDNENEIIHFLKKVDQKYKED